MKPSVLPIRILRIGHEDANTRQHRAAKRFICKRKFLNPARDGAVLPILHLNGFKIANPTVLARISRQELTELLRGYGYDPHFVEGDDPAVVHQRLAGTLDAILAQSRQIQGAARSRGETQSLERPRWPMTVFRTPKDPRGNYRIGRVRTTKG